MIDRYKPPTPKRRKVSISPEEMGLPDTAHSLRLDRGQRRAAVTRDTKAPEPWTPRVDVDERVARAPAMLV